MKRINLLKTIMAFATASVVMPIPFANAMGVCLNPPACTAVTDSGPSGPTIMPPPPPPPGGGGGGWGSFGDGLVGGIGAGVGFGLVQGLTQPRPQPQVIYQQAPQPQPVYTSPPQPVSSGVTSYDLACKQKYKSYNFQTKMYLSYSGVYKPCRL